MSIFERNVSIIQRDQQQFKLLEAIRNNDYNSVIRALEQGANPNHTLPLYAHPIKECIDFARDRKILDALIQRGADTSLTVAYNGRSRTLEFLADKLGKPEFASEIMAAKERPQPQPIRK